MTKITHQNPTNHVTCAYFSHSIWCTVYFVIRYVIGSINTDVEHRDIKDIFITHTNDKWYFPLWHALQRSDMLNIMAKQWNMMYDEFKKRYIPVSLCIRWAILCAFHKRSPTAPQLIGSWFMIPWVYSMLSTPRVLYVSSIHNVMSCYILRGMRDNRDLCVLRIIKESSFNTLRPREIRRHFADDIFKCIFVNENLWIPIRNSLKFVPKGPINNILALVQTMARRRPGDKLLSERMMVRLPTHICVTRPQWVNSSPPPPCPKFCS